MTLKKLIEIILGWTFGNGQLSSITIKCQMMDPHSSMWKLHRTFIDLLYVDILIKSSISCFEINILNTYQNYVKLNKVKERMKSIAAEASLKSLCKSDVQSTL
jgi:hypothetical protein